MFIPCTGCIFLLVRSPQLLMTTSVPSCVSPLCKLQLLLIVELFFRICFALVICEDATNLMNICVTGALQPLPSGSSPISGAQFLIFIFLLVIVLLAFYSLPFIFLSFYFIFSSFLFFLYEFLLLSYPLFIPFICCSAFPSYFSPYIPYFM
jgi:hypothetical protein